jgi:hypothetical protein
MLALMLSLSATAKWVPDYYTTAVCVQKYLIKRLTEFACTSYLGTQQSISTGLQPAILQVTTRHFFTS